MIKLVKRPVLFSFSLQDLVRLSSRKVPEANIVMFQDMLKHKKSTRKGSSKLWTWTYLAPENIPFNGIVYDNY